MEPAGEPTQGLALPVIHSPLASPSPWPARAATVLGMTSQPHPPPAATSARVERLVERAMTSAVEEYDDDLAVARLAWLAHNDKAALDQACDICLGYTDIDLASGPGDRAAGPGAVPRPVLLTTPPNWQLAPLSAKRCSHGPGRSRDAWRPVQPQQLTHPS